MIFHETCKSIRWDRFRDTRYTDKYNLSEPGIRYSADLQITRSIERNRERIAEARSDSARQMRFTSRGPGTRFSTWALVQLAAPAHGAQWRAIRFVSYPHVKTNPYRVDEENIFFSSNRPFKSEKMDMDIYFETRCTEKYAGTYNFLGLWNFGDFGKDRENSGHIENLARFQPNFSDPSRISNHKEVDNVVRDRIARRWRVFITGPRINKFEFVLTILDTGSMHPEKETKSWSTGCLNTVRQASNALRVIDDDRG